MTKTSPAEALAFISSLALPARPMHSPLEAEETLDLPQPDFSNAAAQSVAVGSQIASFAEGFDPALRPAVAHAFLLAQLAADKKLESGGTSKDWYDTYTRTLGHIGWISEGRAVTMREMTGTTAQVHAEIIPVLTKLLGPAVAAASSVIAILTGLQNMQKDAPWITLFDHSSMRAQANQFQISHALVENGTPRIILAAFELTAQRSVAQVLFFKFSDSHAKLRHFDSALSIDEAVFSKAAPALAEKLAEHARDNIASIEI